MQLDSHELAWAAGFWDGEGCTTTFRQSTKRRQPYIALQISQSKNPEVLYRFKKAVGGLGSISGPYVRPSRPQMIPEWFYRTNGYERTQAVMAFLWKFLSSTKKQQYKNAILLVRKDV